MYCGNLNVNDKICVTPEGGLAVWLTNKTSSTTVKGYVVTPSTGTDNAFQYTSTGWAQPIGVIYDGGVDTGGLCRVVFDGLADVFMGNTATRGLVVMSTHSGGGVLTGQAWCATAPAEPHTTGSHWAEIGHCFESKSATGLARCIIHFN